MDLACNGFPAAELPRVGLQVKISGGLPYTFADAMKVVASALVNEALDGDWLDKMTSKMAVLNVRHSLALGIFPFAHKQRFNGVQMIAVGGCLKEAWRPIPQTHDWHE